MTDVLYVDAICKDHVEGTSVLSLLRLSEERALEKADLLRRIDAELTALRSEFGESAVKSNPEYMEARKSRLNPLHSRYNGIIGPNDPAPDSCRTVEGMDCNIGDIIRE